MSAWTCRACLAAILVTLPFTAAQARWVQVESENFVFVGETNEKEGRRIVEDLEVFRGTLLALLGIRGISEVRKVRVFGLQGTRDLRDVTGNGGIAGVYTRAADYPVFLLTIKGIDDNVRKTAFHEYTHHILNSYTDFFIPRWYNEGFAEYISSFEVDDGLITIGKPASDFGLILRVKRWSGVEDFTNAITEYPFMEGSFGNVGIRANIFYALSWLGVHYLQSTPELNKGFADYIARINQGIDPTEAFETSFGISQEEFGERIESYWRRNKFRISQAPVKGFVTIPDVTSKTITDDEAEAALWEVRVLFLPRGKDEEGRRAETRDKLVAFTKEHGYAIDLAQDRVDLEIADRQYDEAVRIATEARQQFPDDVRSLRMLADALFHRYESDREEYRDDAVRSREMFAEVLDREPTNPTANSHYPATFEIRDVQPDQRAIDAVTFNLSYNRNPVNFDTYLQAANVFAATGEPQFACQLLDKVGRWIRKVDEDLTDEQREQIAEMNRRSGVEMLEDALQAVPGGC